MLNKCLAIAFLVLAMLDGTSAIATPTFREGEEKAAKLSPYDAALTKAYEALAQKKPDEAQKLFRDAAKLNAQAYLPWLGLADAARMSGDEKAVESALKQAIQLAPERAEPVIAMARLHYARKQYDQAEALLRKAAKLDPKSPVPWVDLGDIYAGVRQDPDKAMDFYREAIQVAPGHAGAHFALGSLLLVRHDVLGAISSLQTAQKLAGSGNPLPSLALGRAYSAARKWKDAREAFTRALSMQPQLVEAYIGRANTYIEAGDRAKGLADLQIAEEINPKNAEVPMRIGMLKQGQGAIVDAFKAYERAVRLEPKLVLAYNNLAWMAASRRERLDDALGWIQKARSLAPKETLLHDTHGWVLRARGDLDEAMAVLQEGIALQPSADLHYHLGVIQMEKGLVDDARNNFRKALQMQPDFRDASDAKKRMQKLDAPKVPTK